MAKNPRKPKKSDIGKAWLKKQELSRSRPRLTTRTTFYIVCEGQTEELYFKNFPVTSAEVIAKPLGTIPPNIVQYAKKNGKKYDQIWCVFDMDDNPEKTQQKSQFDNAVNAATGKLRCAYSNDSFELWFVLHYQDVKSAELRTRYNKILSGIWGIDYENEGKKQCFAAGIYKRLQNDTHASQDSAIKRAQQLQREHEGKAPHQQNPVTTVEALVLELNAHCRK